MKQVSVFDNDGSANDVTQKSRLEKVAAFGAVNEEVAEKDDGSESATSFSGFVDTQNNETEKEDFIEKGDKKAEEEPLKAEFFEEEKASPFKQILNEDDDLDDVEEGSTEIVVQPHGDVGPAEVLTPGGEACTEWREVPTEEDSEEKPKEEKASGTKPEVGKTKSADLKNKLDGVFNTLDKMDEHPLVSLSALMGIITSLIARFLKQRSFNKLMKTGTKIISGDFELIKNNGVLIVSKYIGVSDTVHVPSEVGNVPVRYLNPDFLYSSTNPFDNYKVRSFKKLLDGDNPDILGMDEQAFTSNVREVILPDSIVAIQPGTFSGCVDLKELVVPESVRSMSAAAVTDSGITAIYFNGSVPSNFSLKKYKGDAFVAINDEEEEE